MESLVRVTMRCLDDGMKAETQTGVRVSPRLKHGNARGDPRPRLPLGADRRVFGCRRLVLLCHIFLRRDGHAIGALQHGHRGRLLTSAPISRRRMVAIEFGM